MSLRVAPQLRGRTELELLRAIDDGLAYVDDHGTVVPFISGATAYTDLVITTDAALYYWTLNETSGSSPNLGSGSAVPMAPVSLSAQNVAGAFTGSGTGWGYNGSSSYSRTTSNLSSLGLPAITYEYWLYSNANADTDGFAFEYGNTWISETGFRNDHDAGGTHAGTMWLGFGLASGSKWWSDDYTRPSAGVYHHYAMYLDRATPQIKLCVDGVLQTPAATHHDAATYGNFSTIPELRLMANNAASTFFLAGRQQHVAIYSGEMGGTGNFVATALAHYQAAIPPPVITSYGPLTARTLAA